MENEKYFVSFGRSLKLTKFYSILSIHFSGFLSLLLFCQLKKNNIIKFQFSLKKIFHAFIGTSFASTKWAKKERKETVCMCV